MMKKLLLGCMAAGVLAAGALAVGGYLVWRAASPYVEDARQSLGVVAELEELENDVANRTPHSPPSNGELRAEQVDRFVRVQEYVQSAMGQKMREIEAKYEALRRERGADASVGEALGNLRDLMTLLLDARRVQVEALNRENFSLEEYSWVRDRIFEAAGFDLGGRIDLGRLDEIAGLQAQELAKMAEEAARRVPARNRELVRPLIERLDEWAPLAFFGL
jgi:hypothetical protein